MEVLNSLLIVALIAHASLAQFPDNEPWSPDGQYNSYDTPNAMAQKRFINMGTTVVRRRHAPQNGARESLAKDYFIGEENQDPSPSYQPSINHPQQSNLLAAMGSAWGQPIKSEDNWGQPPSGSTWMQDLTPKPSDQFSSFGGFPAKSSLHELSASSNYASKPKNHFGGYPMKQSVPYFTASPNFGPKPSKQSFSTYPFFSPKPNNQFAGFPSQPSQFSSFGDFQPNQNQFGFPALPPKGSGSLNDLVGLPPLPSGSGFAPSPIFSPKPSTFSAFGGFPPLPSSSGFAPSPSFSPKPSPFSGFGGFPPLPSSSGFAPSPSFSPKPSPFSTFGGFPPLPSASGFAPSPMFSPKPSPFSGFGGFPPLPSDSGFPNFPSFTPKPSPFSGFGGYPIQPTIIPLSDFQPKSRSYHSLAGYPSQPPLRSSTAQPGLFPSFAGYPSQPPLRSSAPQPGVFPSFAGYPSQPPLRSSAPQPGVFPSFAGNPSQSPLRSSAPQPAVLPGLEGHPAQPSHPAVAPFRSLTPKSDPFPRFESFSDQPTNPEFTPFRILTPQPMPFSDLGSIPNKPSYSAYVSPPKPQFCEKIEIRDLAQKRRSLFRPQQWLSLMYDDGKTQRVFNKETAKPPSLLKSNMKSEWRDSHLWVGLFKHPENSSFTITERAIVVMSQMLVVLLSAALFYGATDQFRLDEKGSLTFTSEERSVLLLTTLVVFLYEISITTLFAKSAPINLHRKRAAA